MKTSHKLNDYGYGYVSFSREGRERSRVGVKFLGSKSWLRRGNRGRGTQRKYGSGPPLQEEGTLSLCFRSFCLVPKFLPKMLEVFCSQYKKKLFNSNLQRNTRKDKHTVFTQSRPTRNYKWVTCEVLQSPDKYNDDGSSGWTKQGPRIRHRSPDAFYCVCPTLTQWVGFGVVSQRANETPFSPLATTTLLITAAGQDPGSGPQKETLLMVSLEAIEEEPRNFEG